MFLLSRRWIGFAIVVAVFAALCVRLGFWQYHRLEERLAENDRIAAHLSADPIPLSDVLTPEQSVPQSAEWTRITVEGRFDPSHEVTVRYKTREGQPGVNVVTPLVTDTGDAILVDRGWLKTNNRGDKPDHVPRAAEGEVQIHGWLRTDSGADSQAVTPHDAQVRAISSRGITDSVPYSLYHGYLNLRASSPEPDTSLTLEDEPDRGQGPHLFYAIQWWFFAALAVFGFGYFAVLEARARGTQRPNQAKSTSSA